MSDPQHQSTLSRTIRFCLEQKLVVAMFVLFVTAAGVIVAPFDWEIDWLVRSPVAVDAIPDIGENQQIVFTEWPGRSPQDVEDQVTYPLTVSLLGVPGVKSVRSYSMLGFSTIYVIFNEKVEFYWSRSRLIEKLNSLPANALPPDVQPALGPDATALGQIFWYTLEGRDPEGEPVGGWDLDELRSAQDWHVRYALLSAEGVSEVASVGGFVREYQIDVDPDAMRMHGVTLEQVFNAVRQSNIDVGARTIEINRAEYVVRGLGFIKSLADIEQAVLRVEDNVPLTIGQVAKVSLGPAVRRGALDKAGAEAVGGVAVVRYGQNPLTAIKNVKKQIEQIAPGLPAKAVIDWGKTDQPGVDQFAAEHGLEDFADSGGEWLTWLRENDRDKWPEWITTSQVTIVPFYDRTGLIYETLGTLNRALVEEILITIIVVIVMVLHLRSSLIVSSLLPLAVLMTFIAMKVFGVDANIVALSGIAIAIGTMVDMGIVLTENILKHLETAGPDESRLEVIHRASTEVGSAVLTAVATTVVGFLPVFTMIGAEGKLFRPLAFTKTFALIASVIVALAVIPPLAHILLSKRIRWPDGFNRLTRHRAVRLPLNLIVALLVAWLLAEHWLPLGPERGLIRNLIFVAVLIGGLLALFVLFERAYAPILRWCLDHKVAFLTAPVALVVLGACIWLGFDRVFSFAPSERLRQTTTWKQASEALPGLGKEFMPALDEGSYLYMPTTMPHASIGEALDVLQKLDMAIASIPEIDSVVGKLGRAETPLDPAPVSMIETVVNYKSEYATDRHGRRIKFRFDKKIGRFLRDEHGQLIPRDDGRPYRQWRKHIRTADDIWKEIEKAARLPGTTGAPRLQPIAARIVMLQSGMRAPMGIKVRGPDLETIERVGLKIEQLLKHAPGVEPAAVIADRIVGKPYLEIDIDREAIARYGLSVAQVQEVIEVAIGGKTLTRTVEGRQRYPVRVRYQRELRDQIETLGQILVATAEGTQIPLAQVTEIRYLRGPQVIKSEDTFLIGYVLFDKKPGHAEVDVVEQVSLYLEQKRTEGALVLPAGVSYSFAGSYESQIRAQKTLSIVLPVSLLIIFLILYFQFRSVSTALLVFSGIVVAWAGGFVMLWLYGRPWFLDFDVFGVSMRQLFQVHPINLSVAVWVGFLALFGIASDNGVIIGTYLNQSFSRRQPATVAHIRQATIEAGVRRVRPCLMTTATTLLALLPVLTSTGRGADIMVPMAIPCFGGMAVVMVTVFLVPVLYCGIKELRLALERKDGEKTS